MFQYQVFMRQSVVAFVCYYILEKYFYVAG